MPVCDVMITPSVISQIEKIENHEEIECDLSSNGFEKNLGQFNSLSIESGVLYKTGQGGVSVFLLEDRIAFQFHQFQYNGVDIDENGDGDPVFIHDGEDEMFSIDVESYRMDIVLEGANPNPTILESSRSDYFVNYYNKEVLCAPSFREITYLNIYDHIDWVLRPTPTGIKYDFVLHPGANSEDIQLRFDAAEELFVNSDGELIYSNRMGQITEAPPVSYQNGKEVPTTFNLDGNILTFNVGEYSSSETLTIDPDLTWSTYYGGEGADRSRGLAIDSEENVYISGWTDSFDGIAQLGHQLTYGGGTRDAFLSKYNEDGAPIWATYYGGSSFDSGYSCAVDENDNIYMTGYTSSSSGIAENGAQNVYGGGVWDAFIVKFDSSGTRQWGTYLGGSGYEHALDCNINLNNELIVSGWTTSTNAIAHSGHQNEYGGDPFDAFITKYDENGTLLWSSYYGGSDNDIGRSCASDLNGNIYLCGYTASPNNIAYNGQQNTPGGSEDGFLVKFDSTGNRLWATYYGGDDIDRGTYCDNDEDGNVFMTGHTESGNNISDNGYSNTYSAGEDAFLIKMSPEGVRQWATYYGSDGDDNSRYCFVDEFGDVYIAGRTTSENDIAMNGFQDSFGGEIDGFFAKFGNGGEFYWGSYFGGALEDRAYACALDEFGAIYLTGETASVDSIAFQGFQVSYGGGDFDAFLAKFKADDPVLFVETNASNDKSPLRIFPNPSASEVNLVLDDEEIQRVRIFSLDGKLQHLSQTATGSNIRLDVSGLDTGLYLMQVVSSKGEHTAKMLKN